MKTLSSIISLCILSLTVTGQIVPDTFSLPFVERFTTGMIETNGWTIEGSNWRVASYGNPGPAVEFSGLPNLTNYNCSLVSSMIDGNSVTDCRIHLDFDLKLDVENSIGNEKLLIEVFDDTSNNLVYTFAANTDTDWTPYELDITPFSRSKFFKIRFRTMGFNSSFIRHWMIDNIVVRKYCEPPINLVSSIFDPVLLRPCDILLEWEHPCDFQNVTNWFNWDNGINFEGISTNDGLIFNVAIKFDAPQLEDHIGGLIDTIEFYPTDSSGPITLKIWKNADVSQPVNSQNIFNSYVAGEWNKYVVDPPILINSNEEIYIGYEVDSDPAVGIAGVDIGPAVTGYGDLISLDGHNWETLSSFDINRNWNLRAHISGINIIDTCLVLGYNIYREANEAIFLGTTTERSFIHEMDEPGDEFCYYVTALFNDGESESSNITCQISYDCEVGVDDILPPKITIYPNPANGLVIIIYSAKINSLMISDIMGRELEVSNITNSQTEIQLDVSKYLPGIYVLRFKTDIGTFEKKLVIQ